MWLYICFVSIIIEPALLLKADSIIKVRENPLSVGDSFNTYNDWSCGDNIIYTMDPTNCQCYYMSCGQRIQQRKFQCVESLFWNQKVLTCVPYRDHCKENVIDEDSVEYTSAGMPTADLMWEATDATVCNDGRIYHPDPYDCHYFIQCSNGKPYRLKCAEPLFWNQQLIACVWGSQHCSSATSSEMAGYTTETDQETGSTSALESTIDITMNEIDSPFNLKSTTDSEFYTIDYDCTDLENTTDDITITETDSPFNLESTTDSQLSTEHYDLETSTEKNTILISESIFETTTVLTTLSDISTIVEETPEETFSTSPISTSYDETAEAIYTSTANTESSIQTSPKSSTEYMTTVTTEYTIETELETERATEQEASSKFASSTEKFTSQTTTETTHTTTTTATTQAKPDLTVKCETDGMYIPDPKNCHIFYHCSNGIPFKKECGGKTFFDPTFNVCNHLVDEKNCVK